MNVNLKNNADLTKELLLKIGFCIVIFGSIILFYWGTYHFMYKKTSYKVSKVLYYKDTLIRNRLFRIPSSTSEIKNIQNEFEIIQIMKQPYLIMAKNATTVWYALTGTFTLTAVITGILGLLMAKKGWDNTSSFYLKAAFIIFFFSSSYYGIAPIVFNNKETGKFNMNQYCFFNQQQLLLYDIGKQYLDPKKIIDTKSVDKKLNSIDSAIRLNQQFYFDIHQQQIPNEESIFNK